MALVAVALAVGIWLQSSAATPIDIGGRAALQNNVQWYASSSGYRFRYPASWRAESFLTADGTSPIETVVIRGGSDSVSIYTMDTTVEAGLFPDATVSFTLHGAPATRYRDADPATGQPIDRIVVKRPDGRINELRGTGPAFDAIVASFRLMARPPVSS